MGDTCSRYWNSNPHFPFNQPVTSISSYTISSGRQAKKEAAPVLVFASLFRHRELIYQFTKRAILGRYRGSAFGLAWSLLLPILMLVVYTFVFGTVFKVRWATEGHNNLDFASILFSGLIMHAFFSECLVRSPGLITGNANYVKRVVFPLEVLAWTSVLTALFQACISLVILTSYLVVLKSFLHPTVLFLPLIILPLLILSLGVTWFIAAFAVYVRDITHICGVLTTVFLFISPIFYPVNGLPEGLQPFIYLNPLSFIVEQVRDVMIWGRMPSWSGLVIYYAIALFIAASGLWFFQKMRRGFADVI